MQLPPSLIEHRKIDATFNQKVNNNNNNNRSNNNSNQRNTTFDGLLNDKNINIQE